MSGTIPDYIADLLDPAAYPEETRRVELRQTHISHVLLTDAMVYKVKRAVNMGFLDFTHLDTRHRMCIQEVALNRRLSAEIYIGAVPLLFNGEHHTFRQSDGSSKIVDWAVKMKRLPDDRSLHRLVTEGKLPNRAVEALAERLADFHTWAPQSMGVEQWARAETVTENVLENLAQLQPFADKQIDAFSLEMQTVAARKFLQGQGLDNIKRRHLEGRYCDGHGDLRLEHIFLLPSWQFAFIDCIEFSSRYRCGDMAADVAFVAMDLSHHRRWDLSERFLAAYAAALDDYDLYRVIDFYIRYRAMVRTKIEAITSSQSTLNQSEKRRADGMARSYLGIAQANLDKPRKGMLYVMTGLMGSGKTTVAQALANKLNAPLLTLDLIRKRLANRPGSQQNSEEFERGIYSTQFTERAYQAMMDRAEPVLESGRPVIVDASFRRASHRKAFRNVAQRLDVPHLLLECTCQRDLLLKRLKDRPIHDPYQASEGREELLKAFEATYEPPREVPENEHLILDTGLPLKELVSQILLHREGSRQKH